MPVAVTVGLPPPLSVARALDAILPGASIRESRLPISVS
jgi:hypothetical protein